MSGKIVTREFSIDDYDAVLQLWQQVEGLEVAEGDDKEGVAQFVTRNPGLSRVAIDGSKVVGVVRAIILVADYNLGGAEFWKRAGWEDIPGAVPMGIDV